MLYKLSKGDFINGFSKRRATVMNSNRVTVQIKKSRSPTIKRNIH